jgi:hypothetical protein
MRGVLSPYEYKIISQVDGFAQSIADAQVFAHLLDCKHIIQDDLGMSLLFGFDAGMR